MNAQEIERLERNADLMEAKAAEFGLDFFPMRYEVCPADVIYAVGSYGMPTRFSHWSFGKQFYRQRIDYDLGLSRIYELVVNSDPCYAFLLDSNTVLQNEVVIAHVLGHADFFKNNARFARTNRRMIDSMSTTAERFRDFEERYGQLAVEEVIDAALAIWEHVDPSFRASRREDGQGHRGRPEGMRTDRERRGPYDDLWSILPPGQSSENPVREESGDPGRISSDGEPEKDLLLFLMENSEALEDWERSILASVREEGLYFWPQMETKIMNEGWATLWHQRIMRDRDLSEQDAADFARMHALVVNPSRLHLNPYYVGVRMWEDIERRYGSDAMFEIRATESDVSFIRNYLTQELVDDLDLYLYERRGDEWVVVEDDYRTIRDLLCAQRTNAGFPVIHVEGYDRRTRTLALVHAHEGIDLDIRYAERALPYVQRLWGHKVTLRTVLDGRQVVIASDGDGTKTNLV